MEVGVGKEIGECSRRKVIELGIPTPSAKSEGECNFRSSRGKTRAVVEEYSRDWRGRVKQGEGAKRPENYADHAIVHSSRGFNTSFQTGAYGSSDSEENRNAGMEMISENKNRGESKVFERRASRLSTGEFKKTQMVGIQRGRRGGIKAGIRTRGEG